MLLAKTRALATPMNPKKKVLVSVFSPSATAMNIALR